MRGCFLLVLLALGGCDTQAEMPGTLLGTYKVQAQISENTCGAGLGAPDPWAFEADLSLEENLLHWRQEGRVSSGTVSDAKATIRSSQRGQTGAQNACSMARTDTLEVELPVGASARGFRGSLVFAFEAEEGGTCGSLLASQGGTYEALPCQLRYELTGERSGE